MKKPVLLFALLIALPSFGTEADVPKIQGELLDLYGKRLEVAREALRTRMEMYELRKGAVSDSSDLSAKLDPLRKKLREDRKRMTDLSKLIRDKKTKLKQELHQLRLKARRDGKKEKLIELEEVSDID